MEQYSLTEEIVAYDRSRRLSYKEDGDWPHPNHYGFREAIVAAHFILRGYHVLTDYSTIYPKTSRLVKRHYSAIFQEIIGQKIIDFMQKLGKRYGVDRGQPDLFVFHEETPKDPKIIFRDPLPWYFVILCLGISLRQKGLTREFARHRGNIGEQSRKDKI
jgi:hypothetical protein